MLDKTGTLNEGRLSVDDVVLFGTMSRVSIADRVSRAPPETGTTERAANGGGIECRYRCPWCWWR